MINWHSSCWATWNEPVSLTVLITTLAHSTSDFNWILANHLEQCKKPLSKLKKMRLDKINLMERYLKCSNLSLTISIFIEPSSSICLYFYCFPHKSDWSSNFEAKMKFAVFLIISCLCIYSVKSDVVTTWGNVNTREIGTETAVVSSTVLQVKTYKFTFPKVIPLISHYLTMSQWPLVTQPIRINLNRCEITFECRKQLAWLIFQIRLFHL